MGTIAKLLLPQEFIAIGPFLGIGIPLFGVILTVAVFLLLFRTGKKFKAVDGTAFSSEKDCQAYDTLLEKVQFLYGEKDLSLSSADKNNKIPTDQFLKLLKNEGFNDVRTFIKYRLEFQKLFKYISNE